MDLMMGNTEHAVSLNNTVTPFGNVSVLHFQGLKVLHRCEQESRGEKMIACCCIIRCHIKDCVQCSLLCCHRAQTMATVVCSTVAKLLSLGLAKAERVLLTGVAHGGEQTTTLHAMGSQCISVFRWIAAFSQRP